MAVRNAGNKAFRPIEEGERKLEVGRTPILGASLPEYREKIVQLKAEMADA